MLKPPNTLDSDKHYTGEAGYLLEEKVNLIWGELEDFGCICDLSFFKLTVWGGMYLLHYFFYV